MWDYFQFCRYHGCHLGALDAHAPLVVLPARVQGLDANLSQNAGLSTNGTKFQPWATTMQCAARRASPVMRESVTPSIYHVAEVDETIRPEAVALQNITMQHMVAQEVQRQLSQLAQSSPFTTCSSHTQPNCQQLLQPICRFCPFCGTPLSRA